ncbi:SpoIIE family protein phosphatase [Plantactinospora sp. GCM10030261]|uniref:SpoIIE family protein phosphatase n=1 Tax=Plantactinospora sp. GCM10030261 TaxID=3273420 RepID=UPI00360CA96A
MDSARRASDSDPPTDAGLPVPVGLVAAFVAGGEMGGRLRDRDWTGSALGPPATWPPELRQSAEMMLASSAQIVLFWGDDHISLYNDAYMPVIGVKHPAALGQPASQLWPEIWDFLEPIFAEIRRTGRPFHGTDHLFRLNRHGFLEETYFDVSYDPIRVADGTVGGIYCIVSETTGRVIGERRLRALADLGSELSGLGSGSELARAATTVLARHRADLPYTLIYLRDEASGEPTLAALDRVGPADLHSGVPVALTEVIAEGASRAVPATDFLSTVPDDANDRAVVVPITTTAGVAGALVVGSSVWLALTPEYLAFIDLVAGQISHALAIQRAYEQERARAAELAALDQAKTNFFANVSHEFRTPLTLILGPLETALGDPDLPVGYEQPLAMMHRNAVRLLKLVNTVLDFSRLESGRATASYQPTDLADYTRRLASTFRSAAERAGLRLRVDCPPLPAPVFVDREMWEKIVLNLLSNALKFTFDGEITVALRAADGRATLTVTDTGVGIDPVELPQIFDRFHRVPGTRSRSHEGTGIGLALVRELAELHGGSVDVHSRLDRGTVFTVTVPLGTDHLAPERIAVGDGSPAELGRADLYLEESTWWLGAEPDVDAEEVAGRTTDSVAGRVLVVDDNADLRDHVNRLLSPYWDVVTAADGVSAFEAAVRSPFDLVLTDVMMPRLDGVGLVRRLRAEAATRHVPIIMLSARAGASDAVAGLAAGADDYLVKPFSGQELVARVRANVELGQLRGQIIQRMRGLADAAVAINTARSTADVLRVAARHAQELVRAARVVASVPGARYEADGGGQSPADGSIEVPLTGTAGERLGELLVWSRPGGNTDAEDAALAQLARLVGVRLENARLYETEHQIATTLQHSLLPESLPRVPGTILASRYLPGTADIEVGGDWYDVVVVPGGGLAMVIGDVVGKGVVAAASMGQLRNALRAYLLEGFDPGQALSRLNRLVTSGGRRSFATVACLFLDPGRGLIRYASGGHPAPLVIAPEGGVGYLYDRALGPPIGALPETAYSTREVRLETGTRLLLYTDGLIEDRRSGIDGGIEWLRSAASGPFDHVEDLVGRLLDQVAGWRRRDDVALLAVELADPDRLALRLPAEPTRLTVLRRRLEDFLIAHDVDEADRFDVTVAVSEAAANAIEHPRTPREPFIEVALALTDGVLEATVRDSGQWREATSSGFRGRGLALIEALAELAVRPTPHGTTVTLRRQLTQRP